MKVALHPDEAERICKAVLYDYWYYAPDEFTEKDRATVKRVLRLISSKREYREVVDGRNPFDEDE